MHVIILSHAEAADPAVIANLTKLLDHIGGQSFVSARPIEGATVTPSGGVIGIDAPDVGQQTAAYSPTNDLGPAFAAARGEVVPPLPSVAAPSSAVAAPLPTAPAAPQATLPLPPPVAQAPAAAPVLPAVAGVASAAAHTSPAGAGDRDKNGLTWDGRIHAGERQMNKDGTWRRKRGVDDALVAQVEHEIRLALGAPVQQVPAAALPLPTPVPTPPVQVPAAAPTMPLPTPGVVAAPNPFPAPAAAMPAAPVAAPVAQQPEAPVTMQGILIKYAPYMSSGQLSDAKMQAALASVGLQAIQQLLARPDLCPAVDAAFAQALQG